MSCDVIESRRNVVRPLNVASEEDPEGSEEFGERTIKRMSDPCKPSQSDIEHHNLTHHPYRNWCRHCVRGRGKESPHLQLQEGMGEVPEFHFDFCFPGEETPGENLIVLVGRMRKTRMTLSTMVPSKSTGEFVTLRTSSLSGDLLFLNPRTASTFPVPGSQAPPQEPRDLREPRYPRGTQ